MYNLQSDLDDANLRYVALMEEVRPVSRLAVERGWVASPTSYPRAPFLSISDCSGL